MQRIRFNRRKRVAFELMCVSLLVFLVAIDQITKLYFSKELSGGKTISVIDGFFYFTYTVNTGAAWSFLSDVSWGQTFFKILTSVALILFVVFYVYASKKGYKWLKISIVMMIGGTLGNFVDRLVFNGVSDFISLVFGNYHFPVFNLADSFLVVGVIMLLIHYCFLDDNAIFRKQAKDGN